MKILAGMIFSRLKHQGYAADKFGGNQNYEVSHVRIYDREALHDETLYIVSHDDLKTPAQNNMLLCENVPYVLSNPVEKSTKKLLQTLFEIMLELQNWDIDMKDALLYDMPLSQLINMGMKMIPHPYALIDAGLRTIAHSSEYHLQPIFLSDSTALAKDLEITNNTVQLPQEAAETLIEDESYHEASKIRSPFYFPEEPEKFNYYCINAFNAETYVARLLISLPVNQTRLERGEELLFQHFSLYIIEAYQRFAGNLDGGSRQNDALHGLLHTFVSKDDSVERNVIENTLESYSWNNHDEYAIVRLEFFEGPNWDRASVYFCSYLEREWPNSCAITHEDAIFWIINFSQIRTISPKSTFMHALIDTMSTHACQAGISDRFRNFSELSSYIRQAELALELGRAKRPHLWYHVFSDYAFEYMLMQTEREFSPKQICHKGLLQLLDYDKKHKTDFANTLYHYLQNNCNTTHTAEKLFIHRSSLLRRLEKIKSIANSDYNDPDEKLYLLLSYKLLHEMT